MKMKRVAWIACYGLMAVILMAVPGHTQTIYSKYRIRFTDKNHSPYSLDRPSQFLSARSILRRIRQGIALDSTDLPVDPAYLDSLLSAGQVHILYTSKWLNLAVIQTTDTLALDRIRQFPFVLREDSIALRLGPVNSLPASSIHREDSLRAWTQAGRGAQLSYGASYAQIHLEQGDYLHGQGYLGDGMLLAMLDAGFPGVDHNPAFDSAWTARQFEGTRDFVHGGTQVFRDNPHGAYCLSLILANLPGEFLGSAPHAHFWLIHTEDANSEQPIEEDNWAAGAELADSAGADIISSSLGYSLFDNPVFNHSYADLNGRSTDVSRAAGLAVKKGMIVVNAAGNEGLTGWKYIIAPADGIGVMAVGAVNSSGQVAPFTSYGPSSDGRVKPDMAAPGWDDALVDTTGAILQGSGTSFATPLIAGLTACLWEAFPDMTNLQIMGAIRESASSYQDPDNRIGYGIPDFQLAYRILMQVRDSLQGQRNQKLLGSRKALVFPNPFLDQLTLIFRPPQTGSAMLRLFDALGRQYMAKNLNLIAGSVNRVWIGGLGDYPPGIYYLDLRMSGYQEVLPLIKP